MGQILLPWFNPVKIFIVQNIEISYTYMYDVSKRAPYWTKSEISINRAFWELKNIFYSCIACLLASYSHLWYELRLASNPSSACLGAFALSGSINSSCCHSFLFPLSTCLFHILLSAHVCANFTVLFTAIRSQLHQFPFFSSWSFFFLSCINYQQFLPIFNNLSGYIIHIYRQILSLS